MADKKYNEHKSILIEIMKNDIKDYTLDNVDYHYLDIKDKIEECKTRSLSAFIKSFSPFKFEELFFDELNSGKFNKLLCDEILEIYEKHRIAYWKKSDKETRSYSKLDC